MAKTTIRELAKRAGVSPAAVSFALNGKKGISEQTRQHILSVAKEADYSLPRAAAGEKPLRFAAVYRNDLPSLDKQFYSELNDSVMQVCDDPHTNLIMTPVHIGGDGAVILPDSLLAREVDGIFVFGDLDRQVEQELANLSLPMVILDSSRRRAEIAVHVDYENAAYVATRHLIDLGHRDIVYLGNDRMHDFSLQTFGGFQRATTECNIQLSTNRIQLNVYDEHSIIQCIDDALRGPRRPSAMFCSTDSYAIHAIRHLHILGLRVPEDISVVGIDDIILSAFIVPSLSTVRVDRDAISRLGLSLLMKQIRGEPCESITYVLDELILRESSRAPSK